MSVFADLARLDAGLKRTASTAQAAATVVRTTTQEMGQSIEQATKRAATALDDFIYLLEQKAKQGDDLAKVLLRAIGDVEAGLRRPDEIVRAFSGIKSTITGEMRDLGALLDDLLDNVEHTATNIKGQVRGVEEALERLKTIPNQAAQSIVQLTEAVRAGQITLDFYLRTLNQIATKAPGTEIGDLARYLADQARRGPSATRPGGNSTTYYTDGGRTQASSVSPTQSGRTVGPTFGSDPASVSAGPGYASSGTSSGISDAGKAAFDRSVAAAGEVSRGLDYAASQVEQIKRDAIAAQREVDALRRKVADAGRMAPRPGDQYRETNEAVRQGYFQ